MSRRLPSLSAREVVAALRKAGFAEASDRGSGSHRLLFGGNPIRGVTVPDHRTIKRGTLTKIIRSAGLTRDEFLTLL